MDYSQFVAPCKKNADPAPRRVSRPADEDADATRQRLLEEQGRIIRTDPVSANGDKGKPCRKLPWEKPNPEFMSDKDVAIPSNELEVIQQEEKKTKPRKNSKKKAPAFQKSRRPAAQKVTVACSTCPAKVSVYPSQIIKAGDVGAFRCKRCLGE